MVKKIMDKLGWTGLAVTVTLIALYANALLKKAEREADSRYTKGISLGLNKGVKGNIVLDYKFVVENTEYSGFVPNSFCEKCSNCCQLGNTVIVRYQYGNPENNDLVTQLPSGK